MGDTKDKKDKKKKSFLKGLKKEFSKVTWPSKAQTGKETFAVIVATIIMALLIVIVDGLALKGVDKITSLEKPQEVKTITVDDKDLNGSDGNGVSDNSVSNDSTTTE